MKEFRFDLNNLKIDQLGYVYRDIKKQAQIMESMYNMPKFGFIDVSANEFIYRGKKSIVSSSIGFSRLFNVQIELIQWQDGECAYKEFLDKGREGLNHISFYVNGLQDYISEFKNRGIKILQSGKISNQHFVYLDTEKTFGIIIELQETISKRRKKNNTK